NDQSRSERDEVERRPVVPGSRSAGQGRAFTAHKRRGRARPDDRRVQEAIHVAIPTLRTSMEIRDLDPESPEEREVCARLLVEEFRDIAPDAWPTIEEARGTVDECLHSGAVRVARLHGTVVGWIGGHHVYSRVWELHPLVVARKAQKQGVGR